MALLVECPKCKKRLAADAKVCMSKTGKGCGASIPVKGRVYWALYWAEGKSKQKRFGDSASASENKTAAEYFLSKIKVKIKRGEYAEIQEKPRLLIRDFVEDHYRPWCQTNNKGYSRGKRYWLDHIVSNWGGLALDELGYGHVAWYQKQMKSKGTLVTFNRVHTTVHHMYTMAIKMKKIDHNPVADTADLRFSEENRIRFLTLKEVEALLGVCHEHLRPMVVTALNTGMRRGEVLGLRLGEHVDLETRTISLGAGETKSQRERHIPVNDILLEVLTRAAENKGPGDYLFAREDGSPYLEVKRSYKTALKAAGITGATFHTLRHTFASHLVMAGVDLYTVGDLLGHADYKQTQKYAHLSPDHRGRAVYALDKIFGSPAATTIPITKEREALGLSSNISL